MVSFGVPSNLVMMKSAPPVEVIPWATMNSTAGGGGDGIAGKPASEKQCQHACSARQVF
jgi:hypothetical protein